MVGFYVAATIVTLVQFLRAREAKLLLLLALFAGQALALSREWWDPWKDALQLASGAAGLALVLILSRPGVRRP